MLTSRYKNGFAAGLMKFGLGFDDLREGVGSVKKRLGLEEETPTWKKVLPYAVGAGVAGLGGWGAYKALRAFRPSLSPALRKLQLAAKDLPFGITSGNPEVRSSNRLERILGRNEIIPTYKPDTSNVPEKLKATILSYRPEDDRRIYDPQVGINFGTLPDTMSNKRRFAGMMKSVGSEHALPTTKGLDELEALANQKGMSIFKTRPKANTAKTVSEIHPSLSDTELAKLTPWERLEYFNASPQALERDQAFKMQRKLKAGLGPKDLIPEDLEHGLDHDVIKKILGHNDFLIKPTAVARSNVKDFHSIGTDPFHPDVANMKQYPEAFIAQEKLPIKAEYRVHILNDEPFEYLHRRSPIPGISEAWEKVTKRFGAQAGGSVVPVMSPAKRARLKAFVKEHMSKLDFERGGHLHQGLDVAELPDGTFRFIESNPEPLTHTQNPFVSRRMHKAVSGRWDPQTAAIGAGAAAIPLGLGAAAATSAATDES